MERPFLLVCALGALFSSALAQDPIVTITTTDPDTTYKTRNGGIIEADGDTDVIMSCKVENKLADMQVRWKSQALDSKGVLQLNQISKDTSVEDNIKYSIEKPTQFTWRLRVKDIQVEDEGNYTCFVYTTRDSVKESNRTLVVAVAPYLNPEQTSSDSMVRQGDSKDLICNATGRPHPTIVWTRLGGALLPIGKEMHFEPKLKLENIRAQDRGTYRCRAFNTIGRKVRQVIRDIHLDVRFPPIVQPVKAEVFQSPGCYRIELRCYVEANPFPEGGDQGGLIWQKGSTVISKSIGRFEVKAIRGAFNRLTYELIIDGVEASDYGPYTCRIKNNEGSSAAQVTLKESSQPQPSAKLGRIVPCGACALHVCLATLLVGLATFLLHRL